MDYSCFAYWLDKSQRDALQKETSNLKPVKSTEVENVYYENLQKDADLFTPVCSTGWRQSDIDTFNQTDDSRVQNMIAARNRALGTNPDTSHLSDEQISEMVIHRNLNMSSLSLLAADIDSYKAASKSSDVVSPEPAQPAAEPAQPAAAS